MLSREELYYRLLYLVPNSKFSFWPDDDRHLNYEDDSCEYLKIDGWCVSWNKSNNGIPSEEMVKFIDKDTMDNYISETVEKNRKDERNKRLSNDLNMISSYMIQKDLNGEISFSSYLDSLEEEYVKLKSKL